MGSAWSFFAVYHRHCITMEMRGVANTRFNMGHSDCNAVDCDNIAADDHFYAHAVVHHVERIENGL